jgi:hypothetical protein
VNIWDVMSDMQSGAAIYSSVGDVDLTASMMNVSHHCITIPTSRDQLLAILRELPADAICLVGYVGDDGDYKALTAADLRGEK